MSNVLSEEKRQQVIALGRLGWSLRRIQAETHIRRETAAGYLRAAGIPVRPAGGWGRLPPAKPAIEVITGSGAELNTLTVSNRQRPRATCVSTCEPYREFIELGLSRGRNVMAIWQERVDNHGFTASYQSVRRFVSKLRTTTAEPRVIIETEPGDEAQVDYGSGPLVRDPQTGKYRRTRLFVLTLGYSRKCVRLLTFRSNARVWAELHEKAFLRLGGATRVVVLDNLREGVLAPDTYDPSLNPLYRDVLRHYGCVALPCRVRDPDRKGKVESGVGHAKKTPLKGLRFESLAEAQAISTAGKSAGPIRAFTAQRSGKRPPCLAKSGRLCWRCHLSLSATTNTANAQYIWTVVSKWKRLITALRLAGSAAACRSSGTPHMCGSSIHGPGSCCVNIYVNSAGVIASRMQTGHVAPRCQPNNCCAAPSRPGSTLGRCAEPSIRLKVRLASAAFWDNRRACGQGCIRWAIART
ncbi:MAG: IS21 family transposase [Acidobacteriaceae bacterium]|nr:IS21 family transposase [Acidobacteriaceae bacterium]